jgi:hypothetical protein
MIIPFGCCDQFFNSKINTLTINTLDLDEGDDYDKTFLQDINMETLFHSSITKMVISHPLRYPALRLKLLEYLRRNDASHQNIGAKSIHCTFDAFKHQTAGSLRELELCNSGTKHKRVLYGLAVLMSLPPSCLRDSW